MLGRPARKRNYKLHWSRQKGGEVGTVVRLSEDAVTLVSTDSERSSYGTQTRGNPRC
jgi:hypothetical protein